MGEKHLKELESPFANVPRRQPYKSLFWRVALLAGSLVFAKAFLGPLVAKHRVPAPVVHFGEDNPELVWNNVRLQPLLNVASR